MNVRPFDFREIAALDDTAVAIRNWLSKSTSFFSDEWVEATGYTAKLALGKISTQSYEQTLEGIPREDLCCVAKLHDQIPSLLCASKEQLQILVADLLLTGLIFAVGGILNV